MAFPGRIKLEFYKTNVLKIKFYFFFEIGHRLNSAVKWQFRPKFPIWKNVKFAARLKNCLFVKIF